MLPGARSSGRVLFAWLSQAEQIDVDVRENTF